MPITRKREREEIQPSDEKQVSDENIPQVKKAKSGEDTVLEPKILGKLRNFRISKATRKKLKERGVKFLFPIQYRTFDHVYDNADVIGQARTGTGKTLSFALPIIERLSAEGMVRTDRNRAPIVLVMAPTRELASQVHSEFASLAPGGLVSYCIYGGAPYDPQERAIRQGLDILVGTPGRIIDHMERGTLNLGQLRHVILDEADRMLESGFAEDVDKILAASFGSHGDSVKEKPQMLLFSATIPEWVTATADKYMSPDHVVVDLVGSGQVRTSTGVEHKALCCPYHERSSMINDIINVYSGMFGRTMVFTSTKHEANELALNSAIKQDCQVLHGDIPQKQREITLKNFREGKVAVLVATDVAARGLDIPEVDLVIQCEPPKDIEAYIHRSGRTGRAGRTGVCVMFYKPQQEYMVPLVERRAGIHFQRIGAPQLSDVIGAAARDASRSLAAVVAISATPLHQGSRGDDERHTCCGHTGQSSGLHVRIQGHCRSISPLLSAALREIALEIFTLQMPGQGIGSCWDSCDVQGFTTYHMLASQEIRSVSYFWKILESSFPHEVKESVKGMRMSKDNKGVVFDLPSKFDTMIKEKWQDTERVQLCVPSSLPDLKDRPPDFLDRMRANSRPGGFTRSRGGWNGSGRGTGRGGVNRPPNRSFSNQPSW
eukprot:Em0002g1894a